MARRTSRPPQRARATNLALQDLHVRARFPGFAGRRGRSLYTWRGRLQPRPTSPAYVVEVRCSAGGVPAVRVLAPPLASGAPHLYRDGTLCLSWPREWTWRGEALMAETILPWTAAWLGYYELWLDTGEWLGPSSHAQLAKEAQ